MITRFLTNVNVKFNPFSARAKPARIFLSLIPPNARADGMTIVTKMLPRASKEPATLDLKFSTFTPGLDHSGHSNSSTEDGKEMTLELEKMRITDVMEEVDRHSRQLARKEELAGN